jgi:Response regulator containing CheY-like receiver, AAA-type ATPase, and DNA-binding domains
MSIRVLLVDDETDFIDTMVKRFGIRKMPVVAASSGKEALERVAEQEFDVVILDMRMPGMDGLETLKEIRRVSPLTEVIMLTGHASLETGMQGMNLGAYDYILKPADFDELLDKVRKAYERKQLNARVSS